MSNVLELRQITRHFLQGENRIDVLSGVDLCIKPGELVALIGPSGSGKSTLLQIAGLLDTPNAGEIIIAGDAVQSTSDTRRTHLRNRHIGFIYQFHHLLAELTAEENIVLPQLLAGTPRAVAHARAQYLLARLGLTQRCRHFPAHMSGGEQQRVAIARALANKPPLILGDEPTGNLDPATSHTVTALLLEIAREEGAAALIATHNMMLAGTLTRAVTLREGRMHAVDVRP